MLILLTVRDGSAVMLAVINVHLSRLNKTGQWPRVGGVDLVTHETGLVLVQILRTHETGLS